MLRSALSRRALLIAAACITAACKDSAPDPNLITIAGGGLQAKMAGTASDAMSVLVSTASGTPVEGVTVTWSTTAGTLASTSTTTSADGTTSNTLSTVGSVPGVATVTAKTGGAEVQFVITVTAVPPGRMEKFSADPTNVGAGAADSIRVRVLDYADAPKAGVAITFSVTAGGGTVSPATVTTNAQGVAATLWTRGVAGTNTVTASAPGNNNSPVSFSVAAISQVASISFSSRVAVVDSARTAQAVVQVKDGSGAAMTGPKVTFVSRTPSIATVDSTGVITGVKSGQAIIVASVTNQSNQTLRDSALAVVAVPNGPVLLTDLTRFDLKTDTTLTITVRADMRTSTEKLGSGRLTVSWDPAVLTYQSNAEAGTNVGASVNANNAASGTLVLAFASSAGFGGNVELRRITFKAASAAAKTGKITVIADELFTAGTYSDLLPLAISVATPLITR